MASNPNSRTCTGPGNPHWYNLGMTPQNPQDLLLSVRQAYREHVNPGLERLFAFMGLPLEWRSEGCTIYDAEGIGYLDCLGGYGVFSLGHRHAKVVEAVKRQLDLMPLSGKIFFNKPVADLAVKLSEIAHLPYSFLCNSGTEAVEGAIKVARKATGKHNFVATIGGFHGKSMGSLSASGRDVFKVGYDPLVPGFAHVPFGDAAAMEEAVGLDTAGIIVEPIQGEGGIVCPPADYLPRLRALCDKAGALLILDEVQTGLGRTGKMFACEHYGVVPDVMTLAKALGGGVMPCGAFLATADVWEKAFGENPLIHTSTFGGNPMAAAAALATIQAIQDEGLCEKSRLMGERMVAGLRRVQAEFPQHILEVRGMGLMIGVEFADDDVGKLVIGKMISNHVLAAYTLNNPRVIRMEPPLIISPEQVDQAVSVFAAAMTSTAELLTEMGV